MAIDELERASEELRAAADLTDGDERDRLEQQAEHLANLAESGADHGRLARHANTLHELKSATGADAGEHIDAAMEAISAYRETIEGV
ncbi:DUF7553 family protein [Haloplanus halobius]|uniref:DUF7553 family protein n=1 Tax=Haloplanus halobius TaxID=2934938 RepID=UPI00201007C6|nr:hypothetical protein [Haloplanus sp. XH21]